MANLIRSAKSGEDWTRHELDAYNITVVNQEFTSFFDAPELPALPESLRTFCDIEERSTAPDDDTYRLLHHLDLAHNPKDGQEAAVNIFAFKLLEKMGYASGHKIIMIWQALSLIVCGVTCSAQADLCVVDEDNILLLVQEDKRLENPKDPEPPLIAEAIAAFQRNNRTRESNLALPPLEEMMFPAITLVGTFPSFFKIKVTRGLSDAVTHGEYPPTVTTVYRHVPRLPRRNSEGMKPLPSRRIIVQYYEAFKKFL